MLIRGGENVYCVEIEASCTSTRRGRRRRDRNPASGARRGGRRRGPLRPGLRRRSGHPGTRGGRLAGSRCRSGSGSPNRCPQPGRQGAQAELRATGRRGPRRRAPRSTDDQTSSQALSRKPSSRRGPPGWRRWPARASTVRFTIPDSSLPGPSSRKWVTPSPDRVSSDSRQRTGETSWADSRPAHPSRWARGVHVGHHVDGGRRRRPRRPGRRPVEPGPGPSAGSGRPPHGQGHDPLGAEAFGRLPGGGHAVDRAGDDDLTGGVVVGRPGPLRRLARLGHQITGRGRARRPWCRARRRRPPAWPPLGPPPGGRPPRA